MSRKSCNLAIFLIFTVIILLFASKSSSLSLFGSAYAQTTCDVDSSLLSKTATDNAFMSLINNYRSQNGVPALTWSPALKKAAAWHSKDMATNNYFSHTDSFGRNPGSRLTECGYNWSAYGENIFPSSPDPQAAFDSWKNSTTHNTAMLNAEYREMGVSQQGNYWTLDLGASSGTVNDPSQPIETLSPTTSLISPVPTGSSTRIPTPSPTPKVNVNLTNTKIRVNIRLVGIGKGKNESPKNLTRFVDVEIFTIDNKKILSGSGFLKYNNDNGFIGDINLGQLEEGVYYIKVRGESTLNSLVVPEFQTLNSEKINVLPQLLLIQGDLDQDNAITIVDYNIALICFQHKVCESIVDVDFNDDGKEDIVDYNILLASFKRAEGD